MDRGRVPRLSTGADIKKTKVRRKGMSMGLILAGMGILLLLIILFVVVVAVSTAVSSAILDEED